MAFGGRIALAFALTLLLRGMAEIWRLLSAFLVSRI